MQHNFLLLLTFFLTIQCLYANGTPYTLVLHPHDRGAYCLDGSPAGMYVNQGNGPNKDKFFIFFNGGGFCSGDTLSSTIQSCYQRSFTELGSTKQAPKELSGDGFGALSPDPKDNPTFHDWTKIFVLYCDGSEHQGHVENPISYKGKDLYFRGTRNALQQFYYLDKQYDFYNKDTIVLSGGSAGGMATFQWVQYLKEHTKTAKVYGMPDSGLFLTDFYSAIVDQKVIRVIGENLLKLVGTDEKELPEPVRMCIHKLNDLVSCYDASNYAENIHAPLFIIESPYDQWSISNLLKAKSCLGNKQAPYSIINCNQTARAVIEEYRRDVIKAIYKIRGDRKDVGIWGPACVQHGFSFLESFTSDKYEIPAKTGTKLYEAVNKFLENPNDAPWHLDEGEWPNNNTGCNGIETYNLVSE